MKAIFLRAALVFSVTGFVFLTGCAITPPSTETANKAARLSTTTSTPGVDGVAVTAAVLDIQEIDPKTGQNAGMWKRTVQIYQSLPTAGEVLKGIMGGTGAALIQGEAAKEVAKVGKCADGGNCGTMIVNQGGHAAAVSGSTANNSNSSGVSVGVTTGSTCGAACNGKYAK